MKKTVCLFSVLAVAAFLSFSLARPLSADEIKSTGGSKKPKDIILTTSDLKDSYKVLGIILARGGEVNLDALNSQLKAEAKDIGADYVIGINYFTYSGYVYAYGTAVKIKE